LRRTSDMSRVNLIEGITERADAGNWCKQLYCTTCGARDLRAAFAEHSSEEIIDGLKALSHDFISDNFDIFLFAAMSASECSSPENTLHMLGATPASGYLQGAIEHHAAGIGRSRRYYEQNSPEALRALRLAKKAKQLRASQLHRDLKNIERDMKKQLIEKLNSLPKTSLIEVVFKSDFETPKRVVGGMVFAKILEQIRKGQISEGDENAIRVLAIEHGGHWKKLDSLLVRASKNPRTLT
jgi:predicted GIY-YIG superfamily endonuclease